MIATHPHVSQITLVDWYAAAGGLSNMFNTLHPNDAGYALIVPVVYAGLAVAVARAANR